MPSSIFINFLWHFPDELSMYLLFTLVLFKFLCFMFFKFSTRYSIFSIDLSCSNSFDEVWLLTLKPKLFYSLRQRFPLIRSLIPSFLFKYNLSTSLLGCNGPTLSRFSLISCPHLSIHSLSTVVFLLRIWIEPLPMLLLLLFCFSHLVWF